MFREEPKEKCMRFTPTDSAARDIAPVKDEKE